MTLPKVNIEISQGNLGRTQPVSEKIALIHTATAQGRTFALNKSYVIRSVEDARTLALQTANDDFLQQIQDFYNVVGAGTELIILGISKTTTFTTLTSASEVWRNC